MLAAALLQLPEDNILAAWGSESSAEEIQAS